VTSKVWCVKHEASKSRIQQTTAGCIIVTPSRPPSSRGRVFIVAAGQHFSSRKRASDLSECSPTRRLRCANTFRASEPKNLTHCSHLDN
jgi:hypothetical protein